MRKRILVILMSICTIFMICCCDSEANDNTYEWASQDVSSDESCTETAEMTTSANEVETTTIYVEPSGVPDSVILRNVSIPENTTYEISHSYDADSHIDDVVLTMYYKGDFGTQITSYSYKYQYDQCSNLWELLGAKEEEDYHSVTFDKEAFLNKSPFTGNANEYHNCTYSISVLDIDMENMEAKIQYIVDFSSSSVQDLNNTATVELWYTNTGKGPCFTIPYKRSMVVMDQMHFMLGIDEGIWFLQ